MKRLAAALLLVVGVLATSITAEAATTTYDRGENAFHPRWVSSYQSATTIEELQFAPDFKPEHANLLRLYRAFFDRPPDLSGAKYWLV
ncbi:MAG: hypothetical protein KJN63_00630, partial [Acidimicrobiia bacterium]|nr:hypothetical protein [Acidimicrobiia bacterium]